MSPFTRRSFLNSSILAAGAGAAAVRMPSLMAAQSGAGDGATLPHALIQPVDFSRVTINDTFWQPKQTKVATATLEACIIQTEQKTGRIRNFEKAARRQGE